MVAKVPVLNDSVAFDSTQEKQELSPKQLKRIEEQKAREAKKLAKRKAKAELKERRALEKENKQAERDRRLEQEREENSGLSAKEMEARERLVEDEKLFAEEFLQDDHTLLTHHVKKSVLESNRLGGAHMC